MKKIILTIIIIVAVIIAIVAVTKKDAPPAVEPNQVENQETFTALSSVELAGMLENKDFTLIDVHIPEQKHIPQTDYFIPYNDVDSIVATVPDRDAKIVLYCRSGNMSKTASRDLLELGYTNVFDLTNGMNEWAAEGYETTPIGSVEN